MGTMEYILIKIFANAGTLRWANISIFKGDGGMISLRASKINYTFEEMAVDHKGHAFPLTWQ